MTVPTVPNLPPVGSTSWYGHYSGQDATVRSLQGRAARAPVNAQDYGAVGDGTTDDTTAINAAITAALSSGATIEWSAGTYLTGASIPNLHAVRHRGPGVITRAGGVAFHAEPHGADVNNLYVGPSGAAGSDGLSPSEPTTFAVAFAALANYGPMLDGSWNVYAAAGTYTGILNVTHSTPSRHRVAIRGPAVGHPGVPTAIIDGTGGTAYEHGIRVTGVGVRVDVRDLKFVGYTTGPTDTTRIGLSGESECDLYTTNIHATGASWCGVYAFNAVRARINGGILDGCRSGYMSNTVQTTITDTIIRNSIENGIAFTRGSQGHADYCVLEDNAIGVLVSENSRVHTVGCNFSRNTYAIRAETGGVWVSAADTNVYNAGTADAQTQADHQAGAYSGSVTELGEATSYARVAFDRASRTITGTTTLTEFAAPYTVQAGRLRGAGKQLRVSVFGVITATAGTTIAVTVGGMSLTLPVPAVSTGLTFEVDATLCEVTGGYRMFGRIAQGLGGQRYGQVSSGFDPAANGVVKVLATPAATADTITVYRTDIYLMG